MKKNFIFFSFVLLFTLNLGYLKSATVVLRAGGTITNPGDWGAAPNGTSGVLANFNANNTYSFTGLNTALSLTSNWTITSGSTIQFGDGLSAISFTLGALITSTSGAQPNMNIKNNFTFVIQTNVSFDVAKINPLSGSTVVYDANSPAVRAWSSNYYNLTINNNVILNDLNVVVDNTLTINSGKKLTLSSKKLTINGFIAGAGTIVGDNSSKVSLTGSGFKGTLLFDAGNEVLSELTIGLSSGTASVALGSVLSIDNGGLGTGFNLNNGILDVSSRTLTIENTTDANFNGGSIFANSSSALIINAANITGAMALASGGQTIGTFSLNSNGNTVSLSGSMNIIDFLTITDGTFDASGGTLTLKSSSGKVGSLGPVGGTLTGNITVESLFPAGTTGWCLLGANGVSGLHVSDWDSQVAITCTNCSNSPSSLGSWFRSLQGWDEANCQYDTAIDINTPLTPGKGFWIYLGNGYPTSTNMTWSFTGPAVQGPTSVTVSAMGTCTSGASSNFNLVANPYPCSISWTSLSANNSSNFGDVFYTWPRGSSVAGTFSASLGAGTGGVTDVIPPGEGFFIDNGFFTFPPSIDFSEGDKVTTNTKNLYKQSGHNNHPITPLNNHNAFRLNLSGPYGNDDAIFSISPNTSLSYQKREDAVKLFSTPGYGGGQASYSKYTTISSRDAAGNDMAINSFPPMSHSVAIPVLVKVAATGSHTLDASDFDNYQSCIVLRDKLTGALTDLKINTYVFNISDTTSVPRFELIICESGGGVVAVNEMYASSNISIGKDQGVPVVKTTFDKSTDAVISVYNIIGQQLVSDIKVSGAQTTTRLDNLNVHNQVVLVKVTAGDKSITKKIMVE